MKRLGPVGDALRGFAEGCLAVEVAFAGDNNVGALQVSVEFEEIQDMVDTFADVGVKECGETGSQSSGRSSYCRVTMSVITMPGLRAPTRIPVPFISATRASVR